MAAAKGARGAAPERRRRPTSKRGRRKAAADAGHEAALRRPIASFEQMLQDASTGGSSLEADLPAEVFAARVEQAIQTILNEGFAEWPALLEELAIASRRDPQGPEVLGIALRLLDNHGFRDCAAVLCDERAKDIREPMRDLLKSTRANVHAVLNGRTDYDVGSALLACARDLRCAEPWLPINDAAKWSGKSEWKIRKWIQRVRDPLPVLGEDGKPLVLITDPNGKLRPSVKPYRVRLSDVRALDERRAAHGRPGETIRGRISGKRGNGRQEAGGDTGDG